VFLSCVFINFIFVFLTSGQDCNSGMQKRIHFRTDMEHNICRPANNSDVSLGYQFCKNINFILYIIYNVRYTNIQLLYSYNFNPIKNTHLRHVTVHYFSRIVQPEAVFFPYWTSKTFFFVLYIM
jgi:hypothetical protein